MGTVLQFSNQFASADGHGIARYSREMHAAMVDHTDWTITPVAGWSNLPPAKLERLKQTSGLKLTGLGRRATPLLWTYLDWPTVEARVDRDADIVHAMSLGYPIATRKPYVVTVHDLGPLTHPEYFSNTRPWVMERSLRQAEQRAAAIVCVSQSTADEVTSYLGAGVSDRLHVVGEGVSGEFFDPVPAPDFSDLDLPPDGVPFILSAGKMSPRKNLQGVVRGLRKICDEVPHHLVIVGGRGWDWDVLDRELQSPEVRERVHVNGFVTDEQLRALYGRAAAYIHPSLYEGFGLTVLEAMAAGAPVIASRTTSLPEVAGDAAILIDPTDDNGLAQAMLDILTDEHRAQTLVAKGKARAASFQWSDCAKAMAALYDGVLS
ncbi:MAG: glycosyltransferase family 1 protein [Pseudomonadota bacterium]